MKRHKYLILFTLLFATSYVFSQQKVKDEQTYIKSQNGNISGFISDENGEPIIGASVIIKGSKVGTVSDVNGKFSLIGSSSDALTVSYLGYYTQTKKMNGQLSAKIILEEDSKNLDEVVVVGYGSAKKATLTGSISSIKSNEILTTKSSKLVNALQGKVSGVLIRQASGEPGKFSSMLSIRGFGTPLIVIDGVVRDGITEFERLNQEDIESISVLKDASAAVYGMNADNGVIIVTTKRGTKGKASISYSGNYGINIPTSMIQMMDLSTQAQINNEKDRNDKITARYSNDELAKYIAGTEIGYQNIDWLNLGLKKSANSQQHNVNIQGGNDDVTYFTSLGYSIDKGLLITDIQKYEKFNLRAGFSAKISKDLTADVTISGRKDYNKSTYNGYIWAYQPLVQARRDIGPYSTVGDGMYSSIPGISGNPLAFMDESTAGYSSWNTVQFQSTASLTYKVPWLSGLSIKALGAFDGDNLQTGTLTKAYTVYDYKTGAPTVPSKPTNLTDSCHFLERTNFQIQASYNKTFAKNHNIFATIVFDQRNIKYKSISAKREWTGLYISDIIDQGSPTSNATNAGSYSSQAYQSFIGRLNYDFKGKYLVEFAFREDGSYRYAPGKRWGLFPSGSCGWRVSEENFFKNMFPSVTNLKFRASYGLMGKDAGSAFQYYSGYTGSSVGYIFNDGALTNGLIYPGVINDNLTWVKTSTFDAGLDLDILNGKFGLTIDYFQKNQSGLLGTKIATVPNTFGSTFPQENLNSDIYRGVDLSISQKNKIGDFEYGVTANVTYSRKYLVYTEQAAYGSSMARWKNVYADNRYLGSQFYFNYVGQFQNLKELETAPVYSSTNGNSLMLPGSFKYQDMNGDGVIDDSDKVAQYWSGQTNDYKTNPPLQFGLNLTGTWKGFDISVLLQGAALFSRQVKQGDLFAISGRDVMSNLYVDRWHPTDPNADPYDYNTQWTSGKYCPLTNNAAYSNYNSSSMWTYSGDYLRIKTVDLGYTIPQKITKKVGISSLRLYVNGNNLYTFCNPMVKAYDPEREEGDYTANLTFPLMIAYNFGFNITF